MRILITGDFCPIHRAEINNVSPEKILDEKFKVLLSQTDLNITNLECPLTNHDKPIIKTGPPLKAKPENSILLQQLGFNLVTLANNHIMDYGNKGLEETINLLKKKNIDYVGAGRINEEIDVIYKSKDDLTIAVVNVCENEWSTEERNGYTANGFSEIEMFYSIQKAKKKAHKVIVIHHGGHEMYNLPSPRLKKTLRYFIDCGADAVVNHHTHCIGGNEVYKDSPIFYSLGNFIFDNPNQRNSIWNYGMALVLECNKTKINFETYYFEQFNDEPNVNLVNESKLKYNITELNHKITEDKILSKNFDDFIEKHKKMYLSYLEPSKSKYLLALINKGFIPSLWNKRKRHYLKNLITCESHHEIVKKILENEISHPQ